MIIVTRERRIDWPRMIDNLLRLGMSMQGVADALAVPRKTLAHYASGDMQAEPPYWVGSAMLLLWAERTGCPWTDAPTRIVTPSVSQVLRESA